MKDQLSIVMGLATSVAAIQTTLDSLSKTMETIQDDVKKNLEDRYRLSTLEKNIIEISDKTTELHAWKADIDSQRKGRNTLILSVKENWKLIWGLIGLLSGMGYFSFAHIENQMNEETAKQLQILHEDMANLYSHPNP